MLDHPPRYALYDDGRHFELMCPTDRSDLPFWLDEASGLSANSVLELACGTGRLSKALAQSGLNVTGIDFSSAMLHHARQNGAAHNASIQWIETDMRSFDLGTQFDLIILTGNSICHLLDTPSLEDCLASIRNHLRPDGKFILSVFVPDQKLLKRHSREPEPFANYCDPNGMGEITVTHTYEYEPDTQIKRIWLQHHLPNGEVEHTTLDMKMYFPMELDALLRYNGFCILNKWADYDRKPFGPDASQQILVCRAGSPE